MVHKLKTVNSNANNQLFLALMLTTAIAYAAGNFLLDFQTFIAGIPTAITCLIFIAAWYTISNFVASVIWGILILLIFMVFLVYSSSQWLIYIAAGFGVISSLYFAVANRLNKEQILGSVCMGFCGAVVVLGCNDAPTFFDSPQLLNAGIVHKDTLFHSSIAAMIKNYGVSSTGLHGLVEIPYHVLSHSLVAAISLLSGSSVFEVYSVAPWVLFVPVLIFSVTVSTSKFCGRQELNLPIAWGFICLILLAAPFFLSRWLFWNSYLISESFLIGCGLFSLGLIPLLTPKLAVKDGIMVVLLAIFITESKGSLGPIYAGLWMLRLFCAPIYRPPWIWALVGLIFAAVFWIGHASASVNVINPISIFKTIELYSFLGKYIGFFRSETFSNIQFEWQTILFAITSILSFLALHFIFSWIAIFQLLQDAGWRRFFKLPLGIYVSGSLAFAIIVAITCNFPTGSTVYFTLPAFFVALPMVVARCTFLFASRQYFVFDWPYVMAAFFVLLVFFSFKHIVGIVELHRIATQHNNVLIALLDDIRNEEAKSSYFMATPKMESNNPIRDCAAKPFLYPAISERAWIGVIGETSPCSYELYGYHLYGLAPLQNRITINPKLFDGMSLKKLNVQ